MHAMPASTTSTNSVPAGEMSTSALDSLMGVNCQMFVERRENQESPSAGERRQFGSSHEGLSPAARELALAIDRYKLEHRRRYVTFEEMLQVIGSLGYQK